MQQNLNTQCYLPLIKVKHVPIRILFSSPKKSCIRSVTPNENPLKKRVSAPLQIFPFAKNPHPPLMPETENNKFLPSHNFLKKNPRTRNSSVRNITLTLSSSKICSSFIEHQITPKFTERKSENKINLFCEKGPIKDEEFLIDPEFTFAKRKNTQNSHFSLKAAIVPRKYSQGNIGIRKFKEIFKVTDKKGRNSARGLYYGSDKAKTHENPLPSPLMFNKIFSGLRAKNRERAITVPYNNNNNEIKPNLIRISKMQFAKIPKNESERFSYDKTLQKSARQYRGVLTKELKSEQKLRLIGNITNIN